MAFEAKEIVHLIKVVVYDGESASAKKKTTKTGTFYIYSGNVKNKRVRICAKAKFAKKTPESKYCLGWVTVASLKSSENKYLAAKELKARQNAQRSASASNKKKATASTKNTSGNGNNGKADTTKKAEVFNGEIGCLGSVKFVVKAGGSIKYTGADAQSHTIKLSAGKILTPTDFSVSESVEVSEHERHMKAPSLEFTGRGLKEISFTMPLSLVFGIKPMDNYGTLTNYMENGKIVALKLGHHSYGNFIIKSLSFTGEETSQWGDWVKASVAVSLLEVV